ncbi:hypothetical protein EKI60_06470 [Candidatus Saccharibacteria bacterium]|nr:MAG: hypothetical protein EKI60_06470 [Candidatus Saccharibacteria bacterium]
METGDQKKIKGVQDSPRAQQKIAHYQSLKGGRSNFESYWQVLHDYFYIEAENVNTTYSAGSELNATYLFDSTTLEAADVLASGFMNYLTPPTSKWFSLRAKNPALKNNKRVATFLEEVGEQVNYTLNKSNFYNQIIASYKSSGVYGTSAMLEEEDVEDDARFFSLPIKNICLVEDSKGRVVEYYIEFEYTARQAADKFGADKLSREMQDELKAETRQDKKHNFLLHIATRYRREIQKTDKKNLPIEASWIDIEGKMIVEEGGYNEFPAFCHRFDKRPFIPWGFSPAMKSLPFARILNAAAKTNLRAMMKHTDPPIAIPDNAFLMPFNANPRAVNYYNKAKMDGSKDIFAFGNFGDVNAGMVSIEYYSNKVKALMYNDVFLAFDGVTKQMNNPEVMERINEKMTMLGPAVGRYISEMLNPAVIRTIGILYRKNKLPEMPDELRDDPQFEIDCIGQLAQAQRRSELNALMTGLSVVGQMAPLIPDVLDKVSGDKTVDEVWAITGAPMRVLRDDTEIEEIRTAKGQMAQQQMAMQMATQGADLVEKGSKIDVNLAKAKEGNK